MKRTHRPTSAKDMPDIATGRNLDTLFELKTGDSYGDHPCSEPLCVASVGSCYWRQCCDSHFTGATDVSHPEKNVDRASHIGLQ